MEHSGDSECALRSSLLCKVYIRPTTHAYLDPFYVVLPDVTRSAAISDGFELRISYVDSRCQNQRMCRFQALSCGRANDILKLAYLDINTTGLDWALCEPLYLQFT